jgi:hypothetical protein
VTIVGVSGVLLLGLVSLLIRPLELSPPVVAALAPLVQTRIW